MDDFCVTRSGKKAWTVVNGATRLLFKMSDHSGGDRESTALTGRVTAGSNTREAR